MKTPLRELPIDKTWTLFLDRDGVINLHYPNDYVKSWEEFFFLEGVLDALKDLALVFRRIIVVTNQQGVGKGLMSRDDLDHIHAEMLREVRKYGGRIHAIYAATDLAEADTRHLRKPATGMAKQAKRDFPEITFAKSIMVGDSATDMQFGKNAGMITVYVGDVHKLQSHELSLVDYYCESLYDFARQVANVRR
ncbi:MAG: HAD-IIIA family hydrolase [Chitinophagales bacterium]|nr:HAD-IIIA family hydrolase [Chitinophagales bacterium]MDW8418072.1 HAD-IIIA family hydrolase [Chitinophagales bacterium]